MCHVSVCFTVNQRPVLGALIKLHEDEHHVRGEEEEVGGRRRDDVALGGGVTHVVTVSQSANMLKSNNKRCEWNVLFIPARLCINQITCYVRAMLILIQFTLLLENVLYCANVHKTELNKNISPCSFCQPSDPRSDLLSPMQSMPYCLSAPTNRSM